MATSPVKVSLESLKDEMLAAQETAQAAGKNLSQITSKKSASTEDAIKKPKAKNKSMDMERFGLTNEAQWLLTVTSRYEDYKNFTEDFGKLYQGTPAMVRGVIEQKKLFDENGNETHNPRLSRRLSVVLTNKLGQSVTISAFGCPGFAWSGYKKGSSVIIKGVPKFNNFSRDLEITGVEIVDSKNLGKIIPVYPPIKGTKGERFGLKVKENMDLMDTAVHLLDIETGWGTRGVGQKLSEITQFNSSMDLIKALHSPQSVDQGAKAQTAARLLSAWTLIRKTQQRTAAIEANPKSIININMDVVEDLKNRIPFKLTGDQSDAITGICRSLRSPLPMTGLLTGDVGSGKTLAFLLPMVAAHKAGKRAMLMTPNLLLISQVSKELAAMFPEVPVCLVTGKGVNGDPSKSIIVGSSALLGAMKKGKLGAGPDFLVVDEQHKFSVEQREQLIDKHTNSLEATATPIPRTAALATHGAKDLFLLQQIPVVKTIRTRIVNRDSAKEARNVILDAILNQGNQAAVIYPIVESDDPEKALKSVSEAAEKWSHLVPMEKIAVLHGRMKDDEKNAVLDSFRSGEKRLLLSSTVIEVGVTLPELKAMLVLGADNFGVVTLHQLRGRLARNGGHGEFMMFSDSMEPEALERLELLVQHQDGFVLAEKDAEKRGYGDMIGIDGDTQSGKTRTVFLGANIGPRHIAFAANLSEKINSLERANMAAEVANLNVPRGESMRLV